MNLYNKLFLSPYFFTIAIKRKTSQSILEDSKFNAEYIMPASRLHWAADPILVEESGKTYMFYEAFHKKRGRLEVSEIYQDCTLSKPEVILENNCHYSYPFVFKYNDVWYMIPESSECKEVSIYRAHDFPEKWEKVAVLLNEKAVDTTVFEWNGTLYLLTFLLHDGSERVTPQAYQMILNCENIVLEKIAWEEFDELKCRAAGPLFEDKGELIRPAQVSLDNRYGDKVIFYNVNPDKKAYKEQYCGELRAENVIVQNWWLDGLHTYSVSGQFEAIDIRCRKVDFLKIPRTILRQIFNH